MTDCIFSRDAFAATIQANPTDDNARLVYADWLDENGEALDAFLVRNKLGTVAADGSVAERIDYRHCQTVEPNHGRRKVRTVDVTAAANRAREKSLEGGTWHATCRHGGDVANMYGYPATTEGVLAISDPQGNVVVWWHDLNANKVTLGGVASIVPPARWLYDGRTTAAKKDEAWEAIKFYHALAVRAGKAWKGE